MDRYISIYLHVYYIPHIIQLTPHKLSAERYVAGANASEKSSLRLRDSTDFLSSKWRYSQPKLAHVHEQVESRIERLRRAAGHLQDALKRLRVSPELGVARNPGVASKF